MSNTNLIIPVARPDLINGVIYKINNMSYADLRLLYIFANALSDGEVKKRV